jgi:2-dehydro-3-deoxygluconokinase
VDYATALGDDGFSSGLIERWQAEGVGTALVRRLPGRLPGLYLIEVDERGERRFSYWRDQAAARAYFDTADGDTPLEQQADAPSTRCTSAASAWPSCRRRAQRLLALAAQLRRRGAMVAFDNNYRPRLWPDRATAQAAFSDATALASWR